MDFADEDVDRLNEETFECAESGDWELDHEEFAVKRNYDEPIAPDANELPRFWETSNDYSLLCSSAFPQSYENIVDDEFPERGVDVEDFLRKLVTDDAFEDPAILDISRKVANQRLTGSALDNILGAPVYPSAPTNILDQAHDIWRSGGVKCTPNHSSQPTKIDQPSLDLITLLQLVNESKNNKRDSTIAPILRDSALPTSNNLSIPLGHTGSKTDDSLVNSQMASSIHVLNNGAFMQSISNLANSKLPHLSYNASHRLPNTSNKFANSSNVQYQKPFALNVPPPVHFFQNTPPPADLTSMLCHRLPPPQSIVPHMGTSTTAGSTFRWPPPMLSMSPNQQCPPPSMYALEMQRLLSLGRPPPPQGHHLPSPLLFRPPTSNAALSANRITNPLGQLVLPGGSLSLVSTQEDEFDPNRGTWMSEYESVGILMSFLRPLVVTNPYVEDYYFAVQWLRRLTAARRIRQQQPPSAVDGLPSTAPMPPIAMSVPSPVTPDILANPNYYHHTSMLQQFVIPLSKFTQSDIRHSTTAITSLVAGGPSLDPTARLTESQQDHQGLSATLGRPIRSNIYRPRVILDLSLGALSNCDSGKLAENTNADQPPMPSVKATRHRLLVLAWIERMFTLLLHISETELSLERIVVQNEMRSRLNQHRSDLVVEILCEFMSPVGLLGAAPTSVEQVNLEGGVPPTGQQLTSTLCVLLSVRKGARLFASLLPYLPQTLKHKCLRGLLCGFTRIDDSCSSSLDELAPLLYPALRHCIYQERDINSLLAECFPDAYQSFLSDLSSVSHKNAICLLKSSMGSSLIFCFLDTCARFSSPDDPSEFIRFGTYFTHLASTSASLSDSADSSIISSGSGDTAIARPVPLDSFTHLASILPLYLSMSLNPRVSTDEVLAFCRRIYNQSTPQANVSTDKSVASSAVASVAPLVVCVNSVDSPLSEPSDGSLSTPQQTASVKV